MLNHHRMRYHVCQEVNFINQKKNTFINCIVENGNGLHMMDDMITCILQGKLCNLTCYEKEPGMETEQRDATSF